jgi:hypothetical protein
VSDRRVPANRPTAHQYWHDFVYDATHRAWHGTRAKDSSKRRYRQRCAPKRHRLRGDAA